MLKLEDLKRDGWQSGINQIIQGDCLEGMKLIPDKSIDLVLTDIPYGEVNRDSNGLRDLDKGVADLANFSLDVLTDSFCRIAKGSVYMFCGIEQVSDIRKQMVKNGLSTRLIIWNKTNPSPMNGEHIWLSSIECCVYGKFTDATFNEFCKGTVLNFPAGSGKIHPTQKPIGLFQYLLTVSSNEKDTILDPFMGSWTTARACKDLNRNFIGFELSEDYCKIGEERLRQQNLF